MRNMNLDIYVQMAPEKEAVFNLWVGQVFGGCDWKKKVKVIRSSKDFEKIIYQPQEYAVWEVLHSIAVRMEVLTKAERDADTLISVFEARHSA